jgi:acyl carrier protein
MGLDSVELIMEVEKHFQISIPDKDAEKAFTVGNLVDVVANILKITKYNFSLREATFAKIKAIIKTSDFESNEFFLNDKVIDTIDLKNKLLITKIEKETELNLPGIFFKSESPRSISLKIKEWLTFVDDIEFKEIIWKKYTDIILSKNIQTVFEEKKYNSKYEIYLVIMNIIVNKIGVGYDEIGLEKSFTDDLGVD